MTDKELKILLSTAPEKDEVFVNRVMAELPKTDLSWRPIWAIRVVTLLIGVVVLLFCNDVCLFLRDILSLVFSLSHVSWLIMVASALIISISTLWVCKQKEII